MAPEVLPEGMRGGTLRDDVNSLYCRYREHERKQALRFVVIAAMMKEITPVIIGQAMCQERPPVLSACRSSHT